MQLVTRDALAPENPTISVRAGRASTTRTPSRGVGLRDRSPADGRAVGVRRFFVRAPDGTVINVVNHSGEGVTASADGAGSCRTRSSLTRSGSA
jgi:hypothetical protein